MNPWLLFTLASAIPGLMHNGGSGYDQLMRIINRVANPDVLSGDTNKLFALFQNSPGFTAALHAGLGGARVSEGAAARGLAASGMGQSGVGSIASAVGAGLANRAVGDVNTNAFNNAFVGANSIMQNRMAGLGLPQPRNTGLDTIGALMSSLGSAYFAKSMQGAGTNSSSGTNTGGTVWGNPAQWDPFAVLRGRI